MDQQPADAVTLAPSLSGIVDFMIPPRTLAGWAVDRTLVGAGRDLRIVVRLGGRLIGQGGLTIERPDIVDIAGYLAGFSIVCDEDIPDDGVAFNRLEVTLEGRGGSSITVGLYDLLRERAFTRLLKAMPPLSLQTANAVLSNLSESPRLPDAAKEALIICRDRFFEVDPIVSPQVALPTTEDVPLAEHVADDQWLIRQFESLGKDCLFGSIQRRLGVEPLGLLRFAGIGINGVTDAINNRFAGVGSPEFVRISTDEKGEYSTSDTRYHMASHTFVYEGDVNFERFHKQQCKKIAFLARKLMEDIELGEKIFIVHDCPNEIPTPLLQALLAALRRHGPGDLLYMRLATPEHPTGTVLRRDDEVLEGFLPHPGDDPAKPVQAITDSWLAVCRRAYQLRAGLI